MPLPLLKPHVWCGWKQVAYNALCHVMLLTAWQGSQVLKGPSTHARLQTKFSKREENSFGVFCVRNPTSLQLLVALVDRTNMEQSWAAFMRLCWRVLIHSSKMDRSQPVVVTRHDLLNAGSGDLGQWLPAHARVVPIKRPAYCLMFLQVQYILSHNMQNAQTLDWNYRSSEDVPAKRHCLRMMMSRGTTNAEWLREGQIHVNIP